MNRLLVELSGRPVGTIQRVGGGTWEFRFLPEFLDLPESQRPVLGQVFLTDPQRPHRTTSRLPRFFSNLLPEGDFRTFLARLEGLDPSREPELLAALGNDLAGAVTVGADDPLDGELDERAGLGSTRRSAAGQLRFSLSGVHFKLSIRFREGRWEVPERGQSGDWIAKFPVEAYPSLPLNEHAMMGWARASGIEVPEFQLVPWQEIANLPSGWVFHEPLAYVVRRFDRPSPATRVHQEDFCQVLNLDPEQKYDVFNYETIALRCLAVVGEGALNELVRRLVFMVLSANGDAHHKNWSLVYPDGRRAALSPAYDLVFTRDYLVDDRLALNFGGSKDFSLVGRQTFRRLGERLRVDVGDFLDLVDQSVASIREAWRAHEGDSRLSFDSRERLRRHLAATRL